jgi:arylsulfatase A-like enzyme
VREAIRFIDKAKQQGKPFFTVVWFGSPHEPYSGLPADLALYDDLPGKYKDKKVRLTSNETGAQVQRPQGEVLRERYAEITAMDRAIGQLRKHLADEGLREDTLFFYCGDNGTSADASLASPYRGVKGLVYEGGIRVPGLIEWPTHIKAPRASKVRASTSDLLPTLCAITGQPLPDRPLDGIDLMPLVDGKMTERSTPLFFWNYNIPRLNALKPEPYIDPELQKGTTPLAKLAGGIATRNFTNYRQPPITDGDYSGARAVILGHLKLVVQEPRKGGAETRELFDLDVDPAEKTNLAEREPQTATKMQEAMRKWQESVLHSLTGADYSK